MNRTCGALCAVVCVVSAAPDARAQDADVQNLYGTISYRDGDYFGAIARFQAAIAGNPSNREAMFNLGMAYAETGDYVEAERVLRRLESLDPAYRGLMLEIGNCLARLGRFDDAALYLARAVAENPAYPGSNYLLGYVLAGSGKYKEAIAPLTVGLGAPVLQGAANYYLSVAYEKLGDKDKALAHLKLASLAIGTEEGRRAQAMLAAQASRPAEETRSPLAWGMFIQTGVAFDSNVPSLPDVTQASLPGFSTAPGGTSRWGSRGELYVSGNIDYPLSGGHSLSAMAGWYLNYHFLPVEAIVPRAEFDANGYDLMLYHLNAAYRFKHRAGDLRLVTGLELGWLDSFADTFGAGVHGDNPAAGPNHLISDFDLVPSISLSWHRREATRLYYRMRVESFYPTLDNPAVDGRGAIGHQIGVEQNVLFFAKDSLTLRLAYENSAADGTQWSWSGLLVGGLLSINMMEIAEFKAGVEFLMREFPDSSYLPVDGSGAESRADKRLTGWLGPEFLIGKRVRLELKYLVEKNFSNVDDRFDFIRHMGMLKVDVTI